MNDDPSFWSRRNFLARLSAGAASLAVLPETGAQRDSGPAARGEEGAGTSARDGVFVPDLALPPFVARPTGKSVLISARNGEIPARGAIALRPQGSEQDWEIRQPIQAAPGEFFEWTLEALQPGTRYEYQVRQERASLPFRDEPIQKPPSGTAAGGTFTTQRPPGDAYTAVLMADSHTGVDERGSRWLRTNRDRGLVPTWVTLPTVVENAVSDEPDFVVALGDNVAWNDSRGRPQEQRAPAETIYSLYRERMGPLTARAAHYGVIGNWEGETGKFPARSLDLVDDVRQLYTPNPDGGTYPQGGSPRQDYYAFRWGDALWVVLNVQSYTEPSDADIPDSADVAAVEDWTLGAEQLEWLRNTLSGSSAPYKFLCIHHAVGGKGGDRQNSLYGRGGGRAATVGEQAKIHALMREYGVQAFFYGHDHVFVDKVVDGIHYALPGSCGAPWKFPGEMTGYEDYWTESGHARVQVTPEEAIVEYVDREGEVLHSFSVRPNT